VCELTVSFHGKDDAVALCWSGHALAFVADAVEAGAALIQRALILNPNLAAAWDFSGWVNICRGNPEVAIEHFARAIRLNPLGPRMGGKQAGVAVAHLLAGRYDDASSWADAALGQDPNFAPALRAAAASNALAGAAGGGAEGGATPARARSRVADFQSQKGQPGTPAGGVRQIRGGIAQGGAAGVTGRGAYPAIAIARRATRISEFATTLMPRLVVVKMRARSAVPECYGECANFSAP
jgi:tetratricopeptide (TPR) repeat protein